MMNRNHIDSLYLAVAGLLVAAGAGLADVTLNSGQVDTFAQTLVGRQGSVVGPIVDNPSPTNAGLGFASSVAYSTCGPVPPGQLVSTPGTSAIATGRGFALGNVYAPSPSGMVIDIWLNTHETIINLDGGSYLATGEAAFEYHFTTTGVTPWTLTGHIDFDPLDTLGWCQLTGFVGTLFFAPGPGGGAFGPRDINLSGTVDASVDGGLHYFMGSVRASSGDGVPRTSRQRLRLVIGAITPPCPADIGKQGGLPGADGLLDNNDFVVFIDMFFQQNPIADMGSQGGIPPSDGLWDNNDFVVFITEFFTGC